MMNGNTILGSDLLSTKEKQYDEVCKRLLSQKVILAHILKACVPEFKDATIEDITNKYIEGIPEIGAHRVNPNEANAPLITGNNTEDSSINEGKVVYDIIFNALAPQNNELIKLLSVLLTDDLKPDTRMRILENDFNIPMTESIESGVSDMCNLSEGIGLDKYEKGLKQGHAAGLAEGETRGKAAGLAEGILTSVKALIANGNYPPEQAMNLLNVPQADRAKLLAQL
jgi:hypothetical protein